MWNISECLKDLIAGLVHFFLDVVTETINMSVGGMLLKIERELDLKEDYFIRN